MTHTRVENWGERRAAERGARRRWRAAMLIGVTVAIAEGVPFVSGLVDGYLDRPRMPDRPATTGEAAVVIALCLSIGGCIGWRTWREMDEVEKRIALNTWAAIGIVGLIAQAFLPILQPALHLADPARAAWWLSLAAGFVALVAQRVRT